MYFSEINVLKSQSWFPSSLCWCLLIWNGWTFLLQGLNYVAALLLLVMKTEEDAFWMLAVLLENVLVNDCYTNNLSGCHVEQRVFKDFLAKKCPRYLLYTWPEVSYVLLSSCVSSNIGRKMQDSNAFGSNGVWCLPCCHWVVSLPLFQKLAFRG